MHAIRIATRISELLRRQRVPLLFVYLRVCILAVFWELCYAKQCNGYFWSTENFLQHLHHALACARSPICRVVDRGCLVVAVPIRLASPIFAPVLQFHDMYYNFMDMHYLRICFLLSFSKSLLLYSELCKPIKCLFLTYLSWEGDMVAKKTRVLLGLTLFSNHLTTLPNANL